MKIISWNVNGIRACLKKGFLEYLKDEDPDILFIQETKAHEHQLPEEILDPMGYRTVWHSAERPGYSGVALFTKENPLEVYEGFGIEEYDREGRVIGAEYGDFIVFGVYFPNGQMREERLQYKLNFYRDFFDHCNTLVKEGRNVIICGDYNTAHKEIDLARPKENEETSGFLPIERDWLDRHVDDGFVDTFREFHKEPDEYTWWTYRMGARARNVGWRIDYFFANKSFIPNIKDSFIKQDVMGSDHCPLGIILN